MRQFGKTGLFLAVLAVLGMFGCGGSSGPNEPSAVYISPPDNTTVTPYVVTNTPDTAGNSIHMAGSLNYGDVLTLFLRPSLERREQTFRMLTSHGAPVTAPC